MVKKNIEIKKKLVDGDGSGRDDSESEHESSGEIDVCEEILQPKRRSKSALRMGGMMDNLAGKLKRKISKKRSENELK